MSDKGEIPALGRIGRGEEPHPKGAYDDFDAWNARFVAAKNDAKTAEVLDELEASHREFVAAVAAQILEWRRGA
jgi:hypothetical protein